MCEWSRMVPLRRARSQERHTSCLIPTGTAAPQRRLRLDVELFRVLVGNVLQAVPHFEETRSAHSLQIEDCCEALFEIVLDEFDAPFGFVQTEECFVRNSQNSSPLYF